ncbi:NADPH-dependent FMN reductase [Desulfatibacillum aliphaticivorans]|uniref:NADPH-dependent FMN reductase n=1 Tax=Desulfatibacillum aliphaticivorans TaxID=218208 RepID=B8FAM4_DESAL|nr:flavodoxin family protein [Desulfatibacillum aliphaticivorans]ACL03320.1 NADPH-dependent FMN reductase [Desulfatibacillum aliphaticivorans]
MAKICKILAINGSQRADKGISQVLLEIFLRGAEAAGAEWDIIHPAKMKVNSCKACYTCIVRTPGLCFQKDDMGEVLDKIQQADLLLFGCPVYFDTLPGDLKRLIDRFMPFLGPVFEFREGRTYHLTTGAPIKDAACIHLCGNPERESMESVKGTFRRIVKNMGGCLKGEFFFPSSQMVLDHSKQLKSQLNALAKAGEEYATSSSISTDTLEAANQEYIFDYHADIAAKNRAFAGMIKESPIR